MSLLGAALLLLLLALAGPAQAAAARPAKPLLPIQPESEPLPAKGAAGCSFGGRTYALEDTWHPDLGEPFGVMHCVVCYCEPQRNRRGKPTGKVSCKNIKHDCPTPPCADAVLLPGHCCRSCPKAALRIPEKRPEPLLDNFEYLQAKEDDLHRNYNDRAYLSSEDLSRDDSRTDFVALLTGGSEPRVPASGAVAKARFSLIRSSLLFSIHYERLGQPSRVRFTEPEGTVLFEHPVQTGSSPQDSMICGIWRNLPKPSIRLLKVDQLRVSLVTRSHPAGAIRGKVIKHRALFAETFSALLTSVDPTHLGMGGLAMLTLSDTENNLHFVLVTKGLLESADKKSPAIPLKVQIMHQDRVLRELSANVSLQDPDFAEVLTGLSSQEMLWLAQGQLKMAVEVEGRFQRQIAGPITVRRSCDTIQSVLCGGDALMPTHTGAVGSAKLTLHANGTLDYQVQVAGTGSEVIGITLEAKPRRRNKRSILYDMTPDYRDGMASGTWAQMSGREAHMLLQNELFLNVVTKDFEEGELRGQINSLPYSGLLARHQELPIPLAGHFVSPPVRTGSAGHAWVSLDDHCHLYYEIVVAGLGRADDGTVSAHLHGFAELGELQGSSSSREHKRLLRGFFGTEAQGVVKDLDQEMLHHVAQGTAFLQVSTKANPRGEIRGRVHIPNHCEAGGIRLASEDLEDEVLGDPVPKNPDELKKDPQSCFFEGQHRAHGSRWAPDYDKKCSICSCQKRTVICDPVICQPLNCSQPVHLEDQCCPVCEETEEILNGQRAEKARDSSEGCYFDGDKTWRGAGTRWHPVVPPFGLIKCAICTCKGATGEVYCEKVQCPRLTCSNPIRASPSDCCKQCPASEQNPIALSDMMQADGPRACRFGSQWYMHNESWHPTVRPFGEMKCITCWCVSGEAQCQRQECSPASCSKEGKTEDSCCTKCQDLPKEAPGKPQDEAKNSWRH